MLNRFEQVDDSIIIGIDVVNCRIRFRVIVGREKDGEAGKYGFGRWKRLENKASEMCKHPSTPSDVPIR